MVSTAVNGRMGALRKRLSPPAMPRGQAEGTLDLFASEASGGTIALSDCLPPQARLRRSDLPAGHQRGYGCKALSTDETRRQKPRQERSRDGSRQRSGTGAQV